MQTNKSTIKQIVEIILAHKRPSALPRVLLINRNLNLEASSNQRTIEYCIDEEEDISLETMKKEKSQISKVRCLFCYKSILSLNELNPIEKTFKRSKVVCRNCDLYKKQFLTENK